MIEFITPYIQYSNYRQYSAIAILHTLQFTVTHALGFSVFTSRILVTDLSQSHWHFNLHMKPSFHSLILFLPLFCNCQFRRLDLVQFLCSQAHIPAGWRLETRLDYHTSRLLFSTLLHFLCPFITPRHRPHRKHNLYC
jgi:hypothetical protein